MTTDSAAPSAYATIHALRVFARDFVGFSGSRFARATVYIALGAVFEGVGLVLLIPLLSLVTGAAGNGVLQRTVEPVFAAMGITTEIGRLGILLGGFVVLMGVRGITLMARDMTVQQLQLDFVEHLRADVMRALVAAGWETILRLRHARIVHIMSGDVQRVAVAVHFLLQNGIALIILGVQCALAFWLSPRLAALAFGLLIIGGIALVPMLRRARSLGAFVTNANLALIDTTTQFLNGLKLAVSQDLQAGFTDEFHGTLAGLRERQLRYFREQAGGRVALTTLSALVGAAAVLVGHGLLHLQAPVLIAFLLIIARMSGPAMTIQQGFQQLAFGLPAYEKTTAVLSELRIMPRRVAQGTRRVPQGDIVFEDVCFLHSGAENGEPHGVRRADLCIAAGTFVGIVGASGAGKTTLADLLVGLLPPQAGRILIGGTPLCETMLPAWRAQLSYVSQDPFLFHDSVRRNLLWANPAATESDMWSALALTDADAVVRKMDGGLDAVVGERGSLISGGERQRIALARALLRKPRLLVMDEATNAIDIPSEKVLLGRVLAIEPRMTVVMIAHRAESLALCDQIMHMENGVLRS
ncbi:MAG: ABC transporter ATP-binding protein [Rhizomicrobium sp.]